MISFGDQGCQQVLRGAFTTKRGGLTSEKRQPPSVSGFTQRLDQAELGWDKAQGHGLFLEVRELERRPAMIPI